MYDNELTDFILCPNEFRFNCAFYEVSCHNCGAKSGSLESELHYSAIEHSKELRISNHPFLIKKKKSKKENSRQRKLDNRENISFREKRKMVKDSLKSEKKVLKAIKAKATIGSGRIFNDGDGYIEIDGSKYYIEIKTRYSDRSSKFPTLSEWKKAKEQGVSIFIVKGEEDIVVMTMDTFKYLTDK